MTPDENDPRTPITILTGWLGAGKTTLLNQLLSQPHNDRIAVLVNEFGSIGIDNRLITRTKEDLIELQNGCVCCSVRGDLVKALKRIRKRRPPWFRKPNFNRIVIETTGIAEPAPLLRTFLIEAEIATFYKIESIVTVIDLAKLSSALLHQSATEQIALADLLILNKIDLVSKKQQLERKTKIQQINPEASTTETSFGKTNAKEIFSAGKKCLTKNPRRFTESQGNNPHGAIKTISLIAEEPLDEMKLELWIKACIKHPEHQLIRYKGFLNLRSYPYRGVLQGTYDLFQVEAGEPWDFQENRKTELVFIGYNLQKKFFAKGLKACKAT